MSGDVEDWPLMTAFRATREGRVIDQTTDDREIKAGVRAAIRIKAVMAKHRALSRPRRDKGSGSRPKSTMPRFL
jgi:hypothetical protein